jgi:hypothetical protein
MHDGQEFTLLLADEFVGDRFTTISEKTKDNIRKLWTNPDYVEGVMQARGRVPTWAYDFYKLNYYDERKKIREEMPHEAVLKDIDEGIHSATFYQTNEQGDVLRDRKGNPKKVTREAQFPIYSEEQLEDMDGDQLVMVCRYHGINEREPDSMKRHLILAAQSEGAEDTDEVQRHNGDGAGVSSSEQHGHGSDGGKEGS